MTTECEKPFEDGKFVKNVIVKEIYRDKEFQFSKTSFSTIITRIVDIGNNVLKLS